MELAETTKRVKEEGRGLSFSLALKKEICSNRSFIYSHKEAVCFGLLLFSRTFDEKKMILFTESKSVSCLYGELIYELIRIKTSITATEQILGDHRKLYVVTVDGEEDRIEIIKHFASIYRRFQCISPQTNQNAEFEFMRGMLCGAFLSCANISDPQKSYHLEFVLHGDLALESLCELLDKLDLKYKRTVRKGNRLVYMKSSSEIEDILTLLGAGKSALEVMNVKVFKNMRNKVNRITNCETANIERTVSAGTAIAAQIKLIEASIGVDALPKNLQDIARLRLENPDMPLSELSQILSPPISRSGAHYRLKQIQQIAQEIKTRQIESK